jgi:hypothetical protein
MKLPEILENYVGLLQAGEPVSLDGVSFYPLTPSQPPADALVALLEDVEGGGLEVRETSQVSELEVVNATDSNVLLLEGDIVAGGRQNRVINTTFVVKPGATLRMPTSCVERGRWGANQGHFTGSGHTVSPKVRSKLKRSVTESVLLSAGKSHCSDQSQVWAETSQTLSETRAASSTDDHLTAYVQRSRELQAKAGKLIESLRRDDLVGVAVTHPDGTAAVEAFGSPKIAAKVLGRIVRAHLLAPSGASPHREVEALLDDVKAADEVTAVPGTGDTGQEVRLVHETMSGSAFLFEGSTLHLSADWEAAPAT